MGGLGDWATELRFRGPDLRQLPSEVILDAYSAPKRQTTREPGRHNKRYSEGADTEDRIKERVHDVQPNDHAAHQSNHYNEDSQEGCIPNATQEAHRLLILLLGLTMNMSGGRQTAEPAGGRPLDGGVRPHALATETWHTTTLAQPAATAWSLACREPTRRRAE
jgi:hypothetical protein